MHATLLSAFGAELQKLGETTRTHAEGALDLGGLGVLAVPSALQLAERAGVTSLGSKALTGGAMGQAGRYLAHGTGEPLMEVGGLGLLAAPVISNMVRSSKEANDPAHEAEEQQVMDLMRQALDLLAGGQNEQAVALIHEALQRFHRTEEAEVGAGALLEGAPIHQEPEGMVTTASALPSFFQELMSKSALAPEAIGAGVGALGGAAAAGMWGHGQALQDQGMRDANFITPEEHQRRHAQQSLQLLGAGGAGALGGGALGHYAPSIRNAGVASVGQVVSDVMKPTSDYAANRMESAVLSGAEEAGRRLPGNLAQGAGDLLAAGAAGTEGYVRQAFNWLKGKL